MIDVEARRQEIYDQAVLGKFNADACGGENKAPKTIEELQAVVKAADFIPGSSSIAIYSPPTLSYWTFRTARLAWLLAWVQFQGDEDKRLEDVAVVSRRLAESEKKGEEATGGRTLDSRVNIRRSLNKKIDIHAADQIVIAGGGVGIFELQKALSAVGQCLPLPTIGDQCWFAGRIGTDLSDALALNLPHGLEAQCGSWRDWILGMTIMLADGSVVKSGSQAVKNVAGYDAHKLFVGARGTLGLVLEVILKTFPIDAVPQMSVDVRHERYRINGARPPNEIWIQRTLPADFTKAVAAAGERLLEADHASSTLWANVPYAEELERFQDDWVIRKSCLDKNLPSLDTSHRRLMKTAKRIFDPTNKFNPGEFGF